MEFVSSLNTILAVLTIAGQAIVVLVVVALATQRILPLSNTFLALVGKFAFPVAFATAIMATIFSLVYSEIIGYEPCKLCWFQRIFIYPQVILLGLAWYRKEWILSLYSVVLSVMGGTIALYQYLLSFGIVPSLPCAAGNEGVSCNQIFVVEFGYITIPLMSLSGFLLILAVFAARRATANTHV